MEMGINTRELAVDELAEMRQRIAELEESESRRKQAEEELRVSEIRYRRLFETAKDGILILDARTGKIADVNPFLLDMLGYSRREILGKKLWEISLFKDIAANQTAFRNLKDRGYVRYENLTLENRAGQPVDVEFVSNVYEVNGRSVIQCSIRDITARKKMERKVVEYEELDKLKGSLLSTVSHELRTPLAIIKGYSAMLVDYNRRLKPGEKSEYLRSIDAATDRLTELVDHLLDMSRLEAGLLKLDKKPISISDIIREVVAEARLRATQYEIVAHMERGLPSVEADARRIRQVLDNLVDNAIKYSAEGTRILIETRQLASEVQVSVADQGIGIPAEELERVFDRMYRIEQRLTPDRGGIGLGLAICRGLVVAHGGRIWVESEVGKGSTFYFTLPCHQ